MEVYIRMADDFESGLIGLGDVGAPLENGKLLAQKYRDLAKSLGRTVERLGENENPT